jgi:hypothetical protein
MVSFDSRSVQQLVAHDAEAPSASSDCRQKQHNRIQFRSHEHEVEVPSGGCRVLCPPGGCGLPPSPLHLHRAPSSPPRRRECRSCIDEIPQEFSPSRSFFKSRPLGWPVELLMSSWTLDLGSRHLLERQNNQIFCFLFLLDPSQINCFRFF